MPVPIGLWINMSMDFILGFPRTVKGNNLIFVIVDHFSRMAYFVGCQKTNDVSLTTNMFFKEVVCLHEVPHSIALDWNAKFLLHF